MNDRDTKFQGFAKLLFDELPDMPEGPLEQWREETLLLIAQRAYDLAKHLLYEAPVSEYEWDVSLASDLTAWPD